MYFVTDFEILCCFIRCWFHKNLGINLTHYIGLNQGFYMPCNKYCIFGKKIVEKNRDLWFTKTITIIIHEILTIFENHHPLLLHSAILIKFRLKFIILNWKMHIHDMSFYDFFFQNYKFCKKKDKKKYKIQVQTDSIED